MDKERRYFSKFSKTVIYGHLKGPTFFAHICRSQDTKFEVLSTLSPSVIKNEPTLKISITKRKNDIYTSQRLL